MAYWAMDTLDMSMAMPNIGDVPLTLNCPTRLTTSTPPGE